MLPVALLYKRQGRRKMAEMELKGAAHDHLRETIVQSNGSSQALVPMRESCLKEERELLAPQLPRRSHHSLLYEVIMLERNSTSLPKRYSKTVWYLYKDLFNIN